MNTRAAYPPIETIIPVWCREPRAGLARTAAWRIASARSSSNVSSDHASRSYEPEANGDDDRPFPVLNESESILVLVDVRAHRHLDTIRALEFAAVISRLHNDERFYREWSDKAKAKTRIDRFKKPLFHDDPAERDPLAFLCVKSMAPGQRSAS